MDRILRNNKKTTSPANRYEPPRVSAYVHASSATSPAYYDTYTSSNNAPPRVDAYVHQMSSESATDTYELPPRVNAYVPAYSTPSAYPGPTVVRPQDAGIQEQDFAYHNTLPDLQEEVQGTGLATHQQPPKRPKPVPPTSLVVEPFGGVDGHSTDALTPITESTSNSNSPSSSSNKTNKKNDLNKRPTCSLSLVCYSRGCSMSQIRVIKRSKYDSELDYETALASTPNLITTDEALFRALRVKYLTEMCGFWRRWLSLKTLKRLRLLSVSFFPFPSLSHNPYLNQTYVGNAFGTNKHYPVHRNHASHPRPPRRIHHGRSPLRIQPPLLLWIRYQLDRLGIPAPAT